MNVKMKSPIKGNPTPNAIFILTSRTGFDEEVVEAAVLDNPAAVSRLLGGFEGHLAEDGLMILAAVLVKPSLGEGIDKLYSVLSVVATTAAAILARSMPSLWSKYFSEGGLTAGRYSSPLDEAGISASGITESKERRPSKTKGCA